MASARKFAYRIQRFPAKGRGKGRAGVVGSRKVTVSGTVRRPGKSPVKDVVVKKKPGRLEAGKKLKSKLLGKYASQAKKKRR